MIVLEISVTQDHMIDCMFESCKDNKLPLKNPVFEAIKNVLPISFIDFRHIEFTTCKTWKEGPHLRTHYDQYVTFLPPIASAFLQKYFKRRLLKRISMKPIKFEIMVPTALVDKLGEDMLDALIALQTGIIKKVVQKFGQ